jgi:tetratricopeptide (TPR) repeat protein
MNTLKDFFISYNKADRQWAEWIAWTLEEEGYSVVIQAWDFRPGGNFVLEMQQAAVGTQKTIAVLSEDYLKAEYTQPEWAAAFAQDPQGKNRTLIPIRVRKCSPTGLLAPIIWADLVDLSEDEAQETLLKSLQERAKPLQKTAFPGVQDRVISEKAISEKAIFPEQIQTPWMVPYERNPHFTGREDVLQQLEAALLQNNTAALTQPQAIRGLGGIGKTQTAVEYAYRHRHDYNAVFWVRAELQEELIAGFTAIAQVLQLPQKDETDQTLIVAAVKAWLKAHSGWLLIVDNADDLTVVRDFLPEGAQGHVLLTTRAAATGQLAQAVTLKKMEPEEGALFLLRRAKRIANDGTWDTATEVDQEVALVDQEVALEIAKEMDGLPLALDQAGAFVEEMQRSLAEYLALYRQEKAKLLAERGELALDRASVTVTFRLAFAKVEARSSAAAALLRICAFLAPDDIPEAIFTNGASVLAEPLGSVAANALDFAKTVGEAGRFSLIERNSSTQVLNIHRLVQEVIRAEMEPEERRAGLEQAILAVNQVFPSVEFKNWPLCERLLPHVIALADLEKTDGCEREETGLLFNQVGCYLVERGQYVAAERFCCRSLSIWEQQLGKDHPGVAKSLNNLAELYRVQGRYSEAEPLLVRSLSIREQQLGKDHPDVAQSLNNLAALYYSQGRYSEAESLKLRCLEIEKKTLGENHPQFATSLNNLAALYRVQGRYSEAEPLLVRSLSIQEQQLAKDHPDIAQSLNNLAALYYSQGCYSEAEPLFVRSLSIQEQQLGKDHPDVATSLNNLAELYYSQGRYSEAEPLYARSLSIQEQQLGKDHPDIAQSLNNLAALYYSQGCYSEAEPLFVECIRILQQLSERSGFEHPNLRAVEQNFWGFIAQVLQEGQQSILSHHPLTQAAIAQLQKAQASG